MAQRGSCVVLQTGASLYAYILLVTTVLHLESCLRVFLSFILEVIKRNTSINQSVDVLK